MIFMKFLTLRRTIHSVFYYHTTPKTPIQNCVASLQSPRDLDTGFNNTSRAPALADSAFARDLPLTCLSKISLILYLYFTHLELWVFAVFTSTLYSLSSFFHFNVRFRYYRFAWVENILMLKLFCSCLYWFN